MRRPNGGYIASPYSAEDGSRDANEYLGRFDKMVENFRLVVDKRTDQAVNQRAANNPPDFVGPGLGSPESPELVSPEGAVLSRTELERRIRGREVETG